MMVIICPGCGMVENVSPGIVMDCHCHSCGSVFNITDAEIAEIKVEQTCRVCGCTWNTPCEGGCYWVEDDLCSKCAETLKNKE